MFHLAVVIICILALIITRKWRDWREHYPTVLYVIIGDLAYNFFFHDYSLWEYEGLLPHTAYNFMIDFCAIPCVVILYLSYFPKKKFCQAIYIFSFALGYSILEYIAGRLSFFSHFNGWNIYWSFLIYLIGFSLIKLHTKHPLPTWIISIVCASAITLIFSFPFDILK